MEISMSQTIKSVYFIIISYDFSVPVFRSFRSYKQNTTCNLI